MDPKQLSEFIARNGKVVGQKTTPRKSLREPETITLEFENGATVTYQPAQMDPDTGEEISPQRVLASNEGARRQSASANESVTAPSNQPNIVSRKPDGTLDVQPNPNYTPDTKPDGQLINAGNGRIILVKPDGSKQVIEEGKPVEQKDGTIVNLGKRGVFLVRADGSSEQIIPEEAPETEKPTIIGGKPYRAVKDAQGAVVRYEPVEVASPDAKPIATSATGWEPNDNQSDLGLAKRWQDLQTQVAEGLLTKEQAEQQFTTDHAIATTVAQRKNAAITSAVTQRGQTLQDDQNRRTTAENLFTTATNAYGAATKSIMGDTDVAGRAYLTRLELGKQYAGQFGGMTERPVVNVPASVNPTYSPAPAVASGVLPTATLNESAIKGELAPPPASAASATPMPWNPMDDAATLEDPADAVWNNALARAAQDVHREVYGTA